MSDHDVKPDNPLNVTWSSGKDFTDWSVPTADMAGSVIVGEDGARIVAGAVAEWGGFVITDSGQLWGYRLPRADQNDGGKDE